MLFSRSARDGVQDRNTFALAVAGVETWEWDLATDRVHWLDPGAQVYHAHASGKLGASFADWMAAIHPADRPAVQRIVRQAIAGRVREFHTEYRVGEADDDQRWIRTVGRIRISRRGSPEAVTGVSVDVSDRHKYEAALREGEERGRVLFDMAPVGIIVVDPGDGAIVASNTRAHQTLGYTAEEFATLHLADVEAWLDAESIKSSFVEACKSGRTIQFETRHRRKDGSIVESLAAAHGVRINGKTMIYKMWLDLTAQKNVERQLEQAKIEAERADFAKTRFLAAASHDLRQPVQSLFFFHSVLAARLSGHPAAQMLENMQTSLDALKALLDGLLDISKLHAGTIEVEPTSFPVGALLSRVESEYVQRALEKDLDFRIVPSSLWVRTDMALFERVLRNLVDNAIKYTTEGGILVGCRREGQTVRVCVVDTGQGIPERKFEDIFHEFVQLGNPERDRSKGLGLGLAIVRHLSHLLGHPIRVQSRLGHGTTFSIALPMARARNTGRRRPKRRPADRRRPPGLALVVDDEATVLLAMRAMMEGMGWDVLAADSGKAAVRLVSGSRAPDVIITDYRLHDHETGAQVIHDIRGVSGVAVPAIVLTGDTSPERILESQRSGFLLIHKPATQDAFETALEKLRAGAA